MSHSHLPVKHLLKQLERFRASRRHRDIRPAWITEFISRVSGLFEPHGDVARVGFHCRLAEDAWEVQLFLGSTELVGGSEDGQTRLANFQLDLLTLVDNFTVVEQIEWHARPQLGSEDEPPAPSFIQMTGRIDEEPLRLQIFAAPPPDVGPGIRRYRDGRYEPVL